MTVNKIKAIMQLFRVCVCLCVPQSVPQSVNHSFYLFIVFLLFFCMYFFGFVIWKLFLTDFIEKKDHKIYSFSANFLLIYDL